MSAFLIVLEVRIFRIWPILRDRLFVREAPSRRRWPGIQWCSLRAVSQ